MGSHFIENPKEYWIKDALQPMRGKQKTVSFLQFVPGVVTSVCTSEESPSFNGNYRNIGSIIAFPHSMKKGIRKKSMLDEKYRYFPLLRGMNDVPVVDDPVLLCTFADVNYYLGPLNTENKPNFNSDTFKLNEVGSGLEEDKKGSKQAALFITKNVLRLVKRLNPKLDNPILHKAFDIINPEDGHYSSNIQHGDLTFEGRHGNSIRVGSRNVHPYIMISNGRNTGNNIESSLDGTIMGIFTNGTIRDHFWKDSIRNDEGKPERYEFKFADDHIETVHRSISKTLATSMGMGNGPNKDGVNESYKEGESARPEPGHNPDKSLSGENKFKNKSAADIMYGYENNQFFLSSDRITFNARNDSMFLASKEFMNFGAGMNINFSTSKTFLVEAAQSVAINTPLFKVDSFGSVLIDGRDKIILGNPLRSDTMSKAVCGDDLVMILGMIINEIQGLAMDTAQAIENSNHKGGAVKIATESVKKFNEILGVDKDNYPKWLADSILSTKVELKK